MEQGSQQSYEFGGFHLTPGERCLLHGGQRVHLGPKALDILIYLVARSGRVITREDLIKEVWGGSTSRMGV